MRTATSKKIKAVRPPLVREFKQYTMQNVVINGKTIPECREIVLQLPITENRRQMPARNHKGLVNTPEYNKCLNEMRQDLCKGNFEKFPGDVCVLVYFCFADHRTRDAQNYEKALFDAFTESGCVYEDDSRVKHHLTVAVPPLEIEGQAAFCVAYVFDDKYYPFDDLDTTYLKRIGERVAAEYKVAGY